MNTKLIPGSDEGEACNRNGCDGELVLKKIGSCTCFLGVAPCSACIDARPSCDKCGFDPVDAEDCEHSIIEFYNQTPSLSESSNLISTLSISEIEALKVSEYCLHCGEHFPLQSSDSHYIIGQRKMKLGF